MAIWCDLCGDCGCFIGEFFVEMSVCEGFTPVFAHGGELDFERGNALCFVSINATRSARGVSGTLESGLKAGERVGRPISAKFVVEDGTLQLSLLIPSTRQSA